MKVKCFANISRWFHLLSVNGLFLTAAAVFATSFTGVSFAAAGEVSSAESLREARNLMIESLNHNQFQRPIYLESSETAKGLKGDIYAEIGYPLAAVTKALSGPTRWCDVMLSHLNTKECRVSNDKSGPTLALGIVSKYDQPLDQAFHLKFAYKLAVATPDYLEVELRSAEGPQGTGNYRILVQATSLPEGRSFLHFTYSYDANSVARMATQAYLATSGRGKVGFTILGSQPDGTPGYIGGARGLVERNAMRYFLGIDAYFSAMAAAPQEQFEKRLEYWFSASERFFRQLHELDRATYLNLKRSDRQRMASESSFDAAVGLVNFRGDQAVKGSL
jgi:hypothetical protein